MKKLFETIGLISLVFFSFFYTEKITNVIKENDDILNEIKQISHQYKIEPINAIINNNTIIPGINGCEIDINKSYKKMKKINSFNSNLLVYKVIKPKISVNKKYDKYIISGNKEKKEVSLLFIVESNTNIDSIVNILDEYGVSAVFFTDGIWFENNNEKIIELIENNFIIGNLGYNYQYNVTGVSWMNTIVTKIGNQNQTYCYTEMENEELLNICQNNKSYTIIPSIITKDNPLIEIKQNLNNGSIIKLDINNKTISQLPLIIEYINSKDLDIVNIKELLNEELD